TPSGSVEGGTLPVGTQELTASVQAYNAEGTNEYFSLILAVYSADGRLLGIGALPNQSPTTEETTYPVTASGFTTEAGAYAKLFFVNDMSILSPLRAEVGLSEGFCSSN
ncbi:MAG: hypothetical protein IKK91_03700, partial [Ruminococcus sp.]|nr:hypothetical protein [Ruminococcus sp.]